MEPGLAARDSSDAAKWHNALVSQLLWSVRLIRVFETILIVEVLKRLDRPEVSFYVEHFRTALSPTGHDALAGRA